MGKAQLTEVDMGDIQHGCAPPFVTVNRQPRSDELNGDRTPFTVPVVS